MGLEQFKAFAKKQTVTKISNLDVWLYTRISSKEQQTNMSLENQKESGYKYAQQHNYHITKTFGGTYESASGDFTRKEFTKLLNEVKYARQKPFAILIFTINRFSRTGGKGVGIATELIEGLGVHLIEISTGRNTLTEEGKLDVYRELIKARQENIDRLRSTMPGMKRLLENGDWLGTVPRGYDHFGRRAKDITHIREKQSIVLNNEGKILRQAWKWKLQGEKDTTILRKLKEMGLQKMYMQTLSKMWRNPFYCGILVNKMIDEPKLGNWEKMVSEQEFLIVQEIINGNTQGYKHDSININRPLICFIRCSLCNGNITGYEAKKKRLHYYKCQKCKGININANTTVKAKLAGANDLFKNLLSEVMIPENLIEPLKAQLKLTFKNLNGEKTSTLSVLKEELEVAENELKKLNRRFMLVDGTDEGTYMEIKTEFETKIANLRNTIDTTSEQVSNLDNYINISLEVAANVNKYWALGEVATKKRIQELVFPEGLLLDVKNRVYLTSKTSCLFERNVDKSMVTEGENEKCDVKNTSHSTVVAEMGVEPMTFGL